jgi:hypothetical protein
VVGRITLSTTSCINHQISPARVSLQEPSSTVGVHYGSWLAPSDLGETTGAQGHRPNGSWLLRVKAEERGAASGSPAVHY